MAIKTTLIAAGALVAASAANLAPAQAASVGLHFGAPGFGVTIYDRDHRRDWRRPHRQVRVLSPAAIRASLRRQGYHRIHWLDRRGNVYVARASGFRNNLVQVTVNARNGHVVNRRVLAWR